MSSCRLDMCVPRQSCAEMWLEKKRVQGFRSRCRLLTLFILLPPEADLALLKQGMASAERYESFCLNILCFALLFPSADGTRGKTSSTERRAGTDTRIAG